MYARFRSRSVFYHQGTKTRPAYNVRYTGMRKLNVKPSLQGGVQVDEQVDLRNKQRLDLLESMRHPKERDFYQDHTYHNQWIQRDLEKDQLRQLGSRYKFFARNFQVETWIWFPGDIVEVTSGESRGQRGTIIAVIKYKNELLVQNINVQDVLLPATETRPEQNVQREHPISVGMVRHVDPETNETCDVRLVTVKNKETGAYEEKRISLSSGVLLPIPARDEAIEVGDPLKDTAYQDAAEPTYDAEAELNVLVERKLRAMEEHFVGRLKESYEYHHPLAARNEQDMRQFQRDVVERATTSAVDALFESLDKEWWRDEIEPRVDELIAADKERADMSAAEGAATAASEEDVGEETEDDEEDQETDDEAVLANMEEDAPTDATTTATPR